MSEQPSFAQLISLVAHELRSPLTSVKGFSNTLVKRWDRFSDDERRQFVGAISSDAERLARIMSEVLDLARLEARTLELQQSEVKIDEVVSRALDRLGAYPEVDRVAVDVTEGLTAWTDQERLERDLANLVENSLKFSTQGPISVTARRAEEAWVEIAVRDYGIGIEKARLPHVLFGPGPRGQIATPKGTGLGLNLARRLLEFQGGSLSVLSMPNVGSIFTMRLPAKGPA